ncbi:MAG: rhomboid family intramembrane serine protease [Gemmatimonadota bacterium]
MFPLRDENPTESLPVVTVLIIGLNVAVWLFVQQAGVGQSFVDSLCRFGAIPGEITGMLREGQAVRLGPYPCPVGGLRWETVLTSMFLHGGWMHLIGNMWFLWVFGNNIEDAMGHLRYLLFYLLAGAFAAAAHILSAASSPVPTVGASGAISGIMGAYLVLYPRVRVDTLLFFFVFIRVIPLPAWVLLGYWFLLQVLMGASGPGAAGGVAVWAHVGGFVTGVLLIRWFARARLLPRGRRGMTIR